MYEYHKYFANQPYILNIFLLLFDIYWYLLFDEIY